MKSEFRVSTPAVVVAQRNGEGRDIARSDGRRDEDFAERQHRPGGGKGLQVGTVIVFAICRDCSAKCQGSSCQVCKDFLS